MYRLDVLQKFGLYFAGLKLPSIFGAMSNRNKPAQYFVIGIEEVTRSYVQLEQLRELQQSAMQRSAQIHRFGQSSGDGIEHQQFSVASSNFQFGAFAFGDVQQESLICGDIPGEVADSVGRFRYGADFAVFPLDIELKVGH